MNDGQVGRVLTSTEFVDNVIRLALIAVLVLLCYRVFSPFMDLMVWALVLAVTMYPPHQYLARRFGGREGRAAVLLVLATIVLLGGPIAVLGKSFASHVQEVHQAYEAGTLTLPKPNDSVAEWPVVGKKLHAAWSAAASNLHGFIESNREFVDELGNTLSAAAGNTAKNLLAFVASLIVAGIMMAYGRGGSDAIHRIACRISGRERGTKMHRLSTMTTRSVAVGVLGVALLQALILGIGFLLAGVPAAGLLAVIVLLIAILQLPALLISLPVIAYLWTAGDGSTLSNVLWTLYFIVGGASDNVLKPLLLGRGVDAPMPVILLGALGGMASAGFIGLFLGAVVLAVGYEIFMQWVGDADSQAHDDGGAVSRVGAE